MKEATVWLCDIGSEVYLGSSHLLIFKGPCASMWPCLPVFHDHSLDVCYDQSCKGIQYKWIMLASGCIWMFTHR